MGRVRRDAPDLTRAELPTLLADAKEDRASEDDAELLVVVPVLRQLGVRLDLDHGQREAFPVDRAGEVAARQELRRDRPEAVEGAQRDPETATIASTMTGTSRGEGPCPGAERAWCPASPQISTIRSLKPFTTFALSWNPGAVWT
jgi:hypothetical protein